MSIFQKDAILIDRYLNRQLSSTEEKSFEERLLNDAAFAELFEEMKLLKVAVRKKVLKSNFEYLQRLESTLPDVVLEEDTVVLIPSRTTRTFRRKLTVAAGIMFFIMAGSFFVLNNTKSNEELFQEFFEIYPNMESERGIMSGTPTPNIENIETEELQRARTYVYYDAKHWTLAISALKELIIKYDKPEDRFFLGIAQLANDDKVGAINTFKELLELSSEYDSRAEWYLAIAYLKNNDKDKAAPALEKIINNESAPKSYREKSRKLLRKIK